MNIHDDDLTIWVGDIDLDEDKIQVHVTPSGVFYAGPQSLEDQIEAELLKLITDDDAP